MASKKAPAATPQLEGLDAFAKVLTLALDLAEKDPEALEGMHERMGNPRPLAPRVAEVDDWVNTQKTNAAAAGDRWKRNMARPKKDPIAEAKKSAGKWKNKMQEAITNDSFVKGLNAVNEQAMLATIEATPAQVFVDGINRRTEKITAKVAKLRPLVIAATETLDKMPTDTDAQREAKMIAARRAMIEVGKRMKA